MTLNKPRSGVRDSERPSQSVKGDLTETEKRLYENCDMGVIAKIAEINKNLTHLQRLAIFYVLSSPNTITHDFLR